MRALGSEEDIRVHRTAPQEIGQAEQWAGGPLHAPRQNLVLAMESYMRDDEPRSAIIPSYD